MLRRDFEVGKGSTAGKYMVIQFSQMVRKIDPGQGFASGERIVLNRCQKIRKVNSLKISAFGKGFSADLTYGLGQFNSCQ